MRALVTLIIGLVAGVLFTVIAMNTLRKGTAYPNGVMAVMSAQLGQLDQRLKAEACGKDDLAGNLQTLAALGNDIEPAFLPTADDVMFSTYAGDYRAAVDRALAVPAASCADADKALDAINATCTACHTQFKS